jgi:hypothetical protein
MDTKNTHSHFGLTFPVDFPLNEKTCRQLAKILLLNPNISVQKAKDIINNAEFRSTAKLLSGNLQGELSENTLADFVSKNDCFEEKFIPFLLEMIYELVQVVYPNQDPAYKNFPQKLFSWIVEFSYPLPFEIKTIATEIKVSVDTVNKGIYNMLFDVEMPAEKIFDYIQKYCNQLSCLQIDELLDLYSLKKAGKSCKTSSPTNSEVFINKK